MKAVLFIAAACLLTLAMVGCGAPTKAEFRQIESGNLQVLQENNEELKELRKRQLDVNVRLDKI